MKVLKLLIFTLLIGALAFILPISTQAQTAATTGSSVAEAQVLQVKNTGKTNPQNHKPILQVTLKLLTGNLKNKTFTVEDNTIALPYQIHYQPGSHVIVTISSNGQGGQSIFISDYDRKPMLLLLLGLFLIFILAIARKQGLMSLVGMFISFYVIAQIIIPNILAGSNAVTITMIGAFIIIPSTYYLAHGFNNKTTVAVVGTLITLVLVTILSFVFSQLTNLTGYSSEEAIYLQNLYGSNINVFNLLIAGIIIGGLAVLNDITISQASIVASLKKSNKNLTFKQLYGHAMDVGKDHVASLVNTLILVYIGASFPLVLLFYNSHTDLSLIVNQEIIATEIVRTLITSIGIIAAVPITTYIACMYVKD